MSDQPQSPTTHDLEAERDIFACILNEQVGIESVKLRAADFYAPYHQVLFGTMTDLWANSCPVNVGMIFHDLVRSKKMANASPAGQSTKAYLEELKGRSVNPDHITSYAGIVSKFSRVRAFVKLGADVIKAAYEAQADPEQLDSMITTGLIELSGGTNDALLQWKDSFDYYENILDERDKKKSLPAEEQERWDLPWNGWNALIDEISPGALMLYGAGTSVGKSIFGEVTAEHWARSGHRIAYFHFELNRELMLDRRTARYSDYHRRDLLNKLSPVARKHIREINNALSTWSGGVEYVHCPGWTIDQVIRQIRSMHAAGLCDGFVIDYLEKFQGSDQQWRRFRDEYKIETDNIERLKNVSEALGLRGVVLAQLTKDGNETSFEDLTLSKIRGAGQKTERVNVVALIHRERIDEGVRKADGTFDVEPGQRSNIVNVRIDKNTMGRPGVAQMRMNPSSFVVIG